MTFSASERPRAASPPPSSGRWVVPLVACIGFGALFGYGIFESHARQRSSAEIPPDDDATSSAGSMLLPEVLETEVALAIERLDIVRLAELEGLLWQAEHATTLTPRATLARLVRSESQATRALDAAIRAGILGRETTIGAVALAQDALDTLESIDARGPYGPRIFAARGRAALAQGVDLISVTPRLLLPGYRDPHLRWAALSRPLWTRGEGIEPQAIAALEEELRTTSTTVMSRLLLALCRRAQHDLEGARAAIDDVVARTPQQPTAIALRDVMDAPPPLRQAAVVNQAPTEPPPPAPPTPAPKPSSPKPSSSVSSPSNPKQPAAVPTSPSTDARTLTKEGCKLVESGNPDRGVVLLRRAFDYDPGSEAITLCLASGYHLQGKHASARALVERVLRSTPSDPAARRLAGRIEDARGNTSAARQHFSKLLVQDPKDPEATRYLEQHARAPL